MILFFPNHEDFYIPISLAKAPNNYYSFSTLTNWTRPVFMMYYKAIGYTGTQGSVALVVMLVILNCALSGLMIKRILSLPFNKPFILVFIAYCYFLFAMPFFYVFYTEDPGSHLSYFFLLLAAYSILLTADKRIWLALILGSVFTTLAFLSKETYELVAVFISILWFFYYRKQSIKRSLVPFCVSMVGIAISVFNNMRLKSVFVNPEAGSGNPYEINLSLISIVREMWRYFRQGFNPANLLMLVILALLVYRFFRKKEVGSRKLVFLIIAFLSAPFLAWLPNALLPNHHYAGYSFNGLYLFYLPLFFLPLFNSHKSIKASVWVILLLLLPASHFINRKKYRDEDHKYNLIEEARQKNLHFALDSIIGSLPSAQQHEKILIKGITFPFSPFVYPESLRQFPKAAFATYDVVNYSDKLRFEGQRDLVRFIHESDTGFIQYNQVWSFNLEGKLVNIEKHGASEIFARKPGSSNGVLVTLENLSSFKTSGFYGVEPGIVWTNGNVHIELNSPLTSKDTLFARLETYLSESGKNIVPRLSLVDADSVEHFSVQTVKRSNTFYYTVFVGKKDIKSVNIEAPILPPIPTDKRILSFPFIELYIK